MSYDDTEILSASRALLERLTPGDLDATLASITHAAVEVLPYVQYASITMRHPDGGLDSYAMTDDLLVNLDKQQYALQEGPCYDATTVHRYAMATNLSADERYPRYGPVAVRAGIRSQAGIRLFENTRTAGGLNLYSRQVGALDQVETIPSCSPTRPRSRWRTASRSPPLGRRSSRGPASVKRSGS